MLRCERCGSLQVQIVRAKDPEERVRLKEEYRDHIFRQLESKMLSCEEFLSDAIKTLEFWRDVKTVLQTANAEYYNELVSLEDVFDPKSSSVQRAEGAILNFYSFAIIWRMRLPNFFLQLVKRLRQNGESFIQLCERHSVKAD